MRGITRPYPYFSPDQASQRGLTRFQFIVAVAVLAVIAVVAVPRLIQAVNHVHSPEVVAAERDLAALKKGLRLYQQDNGRYPTSEQGLLALIIKPGRAPVPAHWQTGGYLDRLPRDPWGRPYQYRLLEDDSGFDVFSFGPAGPEGSGEDIIRGTH